MGICLICRVFTLSAAYRWMIRYKLYHLPFWFVYHALLWTLITGSPSDVASNILSSPYSVKFSFYVVFQAAGVYVNLYFLIPKFLERGSYVQYVVWLMLTTIVTAALIVPGYYASSWISGQTIRQLYGVEPRNYFYFFQLNTLPSTAAAMTLAMSLKLTKNWIKARQRERILEKEKLETELKFLKAQFNPHFLFNSINSIFVLINKNPRLATDALAKFSDLLRYQLYECNEHFISLHQELGYLNNFIELEKLRYDNDIRLVIDADGNHSGDLCIAPFIIMPFVENAFKHASPQKHADNMISIQVRLQNNVLCVDVINAVDSKVLPDDGLPEYGGIGLKNVRRRLELLYPGAYELDIGQDATHYRVRLQLTLQEKQLPEHQSPSIVMPQINPQYV